MPVGKRVRLERLHPAYHLVHQTADLGEVPSDGDDLLAETFLDTLGEALGGFPRGLGERLELRPGALEDAIERLGLRPALDPLLRAVDRALVHTLQMYRGGRMRVEELDYDLPPELIAQRPEARRDQSRLL